MLANVDLDLTSRHDLTPLLDELAPKTVVLHHRRARGVDVVTLELGEQRYRTPEACLARFATLVERLSRPGRRLWSTATQRRFDIGITAPAAYPAYTCGITLATSTRLTALGATLFLTVYPPE